MSGRRERLRNMWDEKIDQPGWQPNQQRLAAVFLPHLLREPLKEKVVGQRLLRRKNEQRGHYTAQKEGERFHATGGNLHCMPLEQQKLRYIARSLWSCIENQYPHRPGGQPVLGRIYRYALLYQS